MVTHHLPLAAASPPPLEQSQLSTASQSCLLFAPAAWNVHCQQSHWFNRFFFSNDVYRPTHGQTATSDCTAYLGYRRYFRFCARIRPPRERSNLRSESEINLPSISRLRIWCTRNQLSSKAKSHRFLSAEIDARSYSLLSIRNLTTH